MQPVPKEVRKKTLPLINKPSVLLKKKLKPIQLSYKIAQYLQTLQPVDFIFMDNTRDAFSLPFQTGEILFKEGLIDKKGNVVYSANKLLENGVLRQDIENKLIFSIIQSEISRQITVSLLKALLIPEMKEYTLGDTWKSYSYFLGQYYAPIATVQFFCEHYPDRLLHTNIIQRLPIAVCNRLVTENMRVRIANDRKLIEKTIMVFLAPHGFLSNQEKIELTQKVANLSFAIIPHACGYLKNRYFDLQLKLVNHEFIIETTDN